MQKKEKNKKTKMRMKLSKVSLIEDKISNEKAQKKLKK